MRLDVLIVTAVPEEYEAVIAAGGGAGAWETFTASTGLGVAWRDFEGTGKAGGKITVGVTQALDMGGPDAVFAAAPLLDDHHVRCVAMCGVCAGTSSSGT